MSDDSPDIDALVAELEARVAARQREGTLPADIDERLESRFATLRRDARRRTDFQPFHSAIEQQRAAGWFSRDRIPVESDRAGGAAIHRATAALVRRQIDGLLGQMQEFSNAVLHTSELLGDMVSDPPMHHHDDLRGDLDMVDARVVELERAKIELDAIRQGVADMQRTLQRAANVTPDIDWGRFAARFRGSHQDLLAHYAPMADRFVGSGPVVDVGCGDGDFLMLLAERDVECWGIEIDVDLAEAARERGARVRHGDGLDVLANLGDDSLGGIVLLQVVEHLPAPAIPELVVAAHRVLRPGGLLLMESPNPQSLYVHTHSFWLDPSHTRPIHPLYLEFLCREAGFTEVEIVDASPVPDDEQLPLPDGDDATSEYLGRVVGRLNEVLFGPQDSAVLATV